ncbi:MAG: hypothetical protein A2W36_05835 [Chloroflexi bacterium RBG_16_58_14]|nr:MAG: hypothetical protein A2W36_05835 [Chloroflexi bacterium RBG_16_58_14]
MILAGFRAIFDDETTKCLPLIHQSIELLMREYFERECSHDFEKKPMTMTELIEAYVWADMENLKESVSWLNTRRNWILHEGERITIDELAIVPNVAKSINFAGELYQKLGYSFDRVFNPIEHILLSEVRVNWQEIIWRGINWQSISETLTNSAMRVLADGEESQVVVDIANEAFEIALRGFARSCGIEKWDALKISELIQKMNEQEDDWAHFYWWNYSDTTNSGWIPENSPFWFVPPMQASDLINSPYHQTRQDAAEYYANEVRNLVKSIIENTPMVDLSDFVHSEWGVIERELGNKNPELEIPIIDLESWSRSSPFINRTITIPVK